MNDDKGFLDEGLLKLHTQLARIEVKLDDIPEIKQSLKDTTTRLERQSEKVDKAYTMGLNNKEQLSELKSKYDWLSKTVIGAIITSIVAILIKTYMG